MCNMTLFSVSWKIIKTFNENSGSFFWFNFIKPDTSADSTKWCMEVSFIPIYYILVSFFPPDYKPFWLKWRENHIKQNKVQRTQTL